MSPDQAREIMTASEKACDATGLAWKALGDDIDAVTLSLNAGAKFSPSKGMTSITDAVGREPTTPNGARWAWTGHIWGSHRRAAYRAMCALFLETTKAWAFDTYPDNPPWSNYDCTAAAEVLRQAGLECVVDDAPKQSAADWRARTSRPVDAGLVLLNTKGNADFFELSPGKLSPPDAPVLERPCAVHIVHSWSGAAIDSRDTVGGRWMERGAFAYFGSVEEPGLQAFVPTPVLASRLAAGFAWGAAVRIDVSPVWKVACWGDPLWTVVKGMVRKPDAPLPLEGTADIADEMRQALTAKEMAGAVRALVLLGRDADVARVIAAMVKETPEKITPAVAEAAAVALFRADRLDLLGAMARKADPKSPAIGAIRDALWLGASGRLATTRDQELLTALRDNVREELADRDLVELTAAWARVLGKESAQAMLNEVGQQRKWLASAAQSAARVLK